MKIYNETKSIEAQKQLADKYNCIMFAPLDGYCPRCRRRIFADGGYSVEQASKSLITGCPFCHYSFCE